MLLRYVSLTVNKAVKRYLRLLIIFYCFSLKGITYHKDVFRTYDSCYPGEGVGNVLLMVELLTIFRLLHNATLIMYGSVQ